MSDKEKLEFENKVSRAEAAEFLEALAKSLRAGSSLLESGDQSLALQIAPQVEIELRAEHAPEDNKGSIELELKWRVEQEETPPSLVIVPGALVPSASPD